MKTTAVLSVFAAVSTVCLTLASGCSGGGGDNSSSSGGSSSGGSSSGNGSTSSSSSSGGSSTSGIKDCPQQGQSSCPKDELEKYTKCGTEKCDAAYKECYGAGYMSGSFSGPCAATVTCSNKCDCADTKCLQGCFPDKACQDCSIKLANCVKDSCTLPNCGGTQGSGKTCADLQACCAKIADATKKSTCEATYNAVKASGDVTCGGVYSGYAADCP